MSPTPAAAQSGVESLHAECVAGGGADIGARCADAAFTVQALHGGVGALASAGGVLPASPSTAGRRLVQQPRIIVDGGAGWSSFRRPELTQAPGSRGVPERRTLLLGGRLTTVVGIFEGFSPLPTMGGVLAVDGVGTAQLLRLPSSDGYSGSVAGWGGGVRIGVVRESFSLPGITLSAMHHRIGSIEYGGEPEAGGARATLQPRVTSFRAVVGKDLLALGVSGGVGLDRHGGRGRIQVGDAGGSYQDLRLSRRYLFGGVNFTWIVAQAAAELAWGSPTSPFDAAEGTGSYRPGGTELQGAVTFRVTY